MIVDILVIGTGISGLTFATKVAETNPHIHLVLISKEQLIGGNTRYAQGGVAVVKNFAEDSHQKHIEDTMNAGAYKNDVQVIEFVVKEGSDRIDELLKWGIQFDTEDGKLHLSHEAGHSAKRIIHHKDLTGLEIQKALVRKIKSFPNIQYFENYALVDLITDHHTKYGLNRCYGAYVISKEQEQILAISSKLTVLSTGGAGQLYLRTTNPPGATGDGLGAAYRARVKMENLPYVQFHPTALLPKVDDKTFLISEVIRGQGAQLKNHKQERFMLDYHPKAELAPRDIVSRAIEMEIRKSKKDYLLLDARNISEKKWKKRLPNIFGALAKVNIDPTNEMIPIVPVAHYFCGGVVVNHFAESHMQGLYAIGECSYTGLHGANRLASNSLLEALVFSHRAAISCIEKLNREENSLNNQTTQNVPPWSGESYQRIYNLSHIRQLRKDLQNTMNQYVGIFKTDQGLKTAEQKMLTIYQNVLNIYKENRLNLELVELRNMVSIAHLIIQQAKLIKENKGVFYNRDNA
ncbi:MAG: L-aspartate oxidase [Flavobacteriaceae bacterium]|nr:L-aspartate oxidase [Flavobacteriaceae bacterium]